MTVTKEITDAGRIECETIDTNVTKNVLGRTRRRPWRREERRVKVTTWSAWTAKEIKQLVCRPASHQVACEVDHA